MNTPEYIPRLFGRQQDKPLKPRQMRLMSTLLPGISIADPSEQTFELGELFPAAKSVWLEIGFGGGEHLAWQAEKNPDVGMIGAEPFLNGVAKLLSAIDNKDLGNIRIRHGDARPLIEAMPDGSVEKLFVLHPDPWPKKRHHKRRMISPWFLHEAVRILSPGGELRVASDISDYIRWTMIHVQNQPSLQWTAQSASDWRDRPEDWPETRYEAKARREGRVPSYLVFRRV